MTAALVVPTFDPDGDDVEILRAIATWFSTRAAGYERDMRKQRDPLADDRDQHVLEDVEHTIFGNYALSPSGVAAQLTAIIPAISDGRDVDRVLVESGPTALLHPAIDAGFAVEAIARAITELIDIQWEQIFSRYQHSARVRSLITDQEPRGINGAAQAAEDLLADHSAIVTQLIRTLVPDQESYATKARIVLVEGLMQEAGIWLVRDANHLIGRYAHRPAEMAA
ncbi:hypothetical protein [uncultured Sphingomonas sp.]|uniref:hypothetical protein n=1 Tax=uncultured Sphingomonas sp. TaxID=158754 RepID=UPI00259909E8|nr:hypothetical protein [uncultured Sphingomonas sp.]